MSFCTLESLPPDLIYSLHPYLSGFDTLSLSQTCSSLRLKCRHLVYRTCMYATALDLDVNYHRAVWASRKTFKDRNFNYAPQMAFYQPDRYSWMSTLFITRVYLVIPLELFSPPYPILNEDHIQRYFPRLKSITLVNLCLKTTTVPSNCLLKLLHLFNLPKNRHISFSYISNDVRGTPLDFRGFKHFSTASFHSLLNSLSISCFSPDDSLQRLQLDSQPLSNLKSINIGFLCESCLQRTPNPLELDLFQNLLQRLPRLQNLSIYNIKVFFFIPITNLIHSTFTIPEDQNRFQLKKCNLGFLVHSLEPFVIDYRNPTLPNLSHVDNLSFKFCNSPNTQVYLEPLLKTRYWLKRSNPKMNLDILHDCHNSYFIQNFTTTKQIVTMLTSLTIELRTDPETSFVGEDRVKLNKYPNFPNLKVLNINTGAGLKCPAEVLSGDCCSKLHIPHTPIQIFLVAFFQYPMLVKQLIQLPRKDICEWTNDGEGDSMGTLFGIIYCRLHQDILVMQQYPLNQEQYIFIKHWLPFLICVLIFGVGDKRSFISNCMQFLDSVMNSCTKDPFLKDRYSELSPVLMDYDILTYLSLMGLTEDICQFVLDHPHLQDVSLGSSFHLTNSPRFRFYLCRAFCKNSHINNLYFEERLKPIQKESLMWPESMKNKISSYTLSRVSSVCNKYVADREVDALSWRKKTLPNFPKLNSTGYLGYHW